jgi:hypothetical protein
MHGEDEDVPGSQKSSDSWKNFKEAYDQCQLFCEIPIGPNSFYGSSPVLMSIVPDCLRNTFYGSKLTSLCIDQRATGYVLVVLGFFMLRAQVYQCHS